MSRLICLVRHGESAWNLEGRVQGQQDPPLSERGRRQAEAVGRCLALEPWDALYCSDLVRAVQTADPITRRTGLAPRQDPDLRERGQGRLEGTLLSEAALVPDVDAPEIGREHPEAVAERCRRAFSRILSGREQRVVVVTHGALIQQALVSLGVLRAAGTLAGERAPRNAGITRVLVRGGAAELLSFDETTHLEGDVAAGDVSTLAGRLMAARSGVG